MHIIQCDKCKTQSEPDQRTNITPDGWHRIEYRVQQYGSSTRIYHLCPVCTKALGLPEDAKVSLADQFLDILSDLATDAVEDAISNS